MTSHYAEVQPPASLDLILRTRLNALLEREGLTVSHAAREAGWSLSAAYRRLYLDPAGGAKYRRLHVCDVDELLSALGLSPLDVLQPVLLGGDRELLTWVGEHTPADPLPSRALLDQYISDQEGVERVDRMCGQGLLAIYGDRDDRSTWYLRLTPAGQRALS